MLMAQNNSKDCLACRLVTGSGVIGIGVYLFAQSKKRTGRVEVLFMQGLSAGVVAVGISRLLNADFLRPKT